MRPTSFLSILFLAILILQQGCAATPWTPWSPDIPKEERAHIRTVGITVSEELPRVTLDLPSQGALSGAGRGAGSWVLKWGSIVGETASGMKPYLSGHPVGLAVVGAPLLAGAPFAAVAGALSGAVEAPSAAEVEAMETQVRGVFQDERLIGELGKQVHDHITNRTDVILTLLPSAGMDYADAVDTETGAQPDARLTIVLKSIGLEGTFDVNPPLTLYLETDVTLAYRHKPHAISDNLQPLSDSQRTPTVSVYRRIFRVVHAARPSDVHTLAEWTADEASPLRKAVDFSLARMAEWIVGDVFIPHPY